VEGYVEQGNASYYGNKFHGRLTSNREVYDMYAFTAAHKSLPLPSFARVTNLDNGRSVVVRVNDRGPFHEGRVIDLSYAAAVKLDIVRRGTGRVEVQALLPGDAVPLTVASTSVPTTIATGIPTRFATGKPTPMDELVQRLPPPAPVLLAAVQSDAPPAAPPAALPAEDAASAANATQSWRYQVAPEPEKAASADEFEAWMLARGVRVATGEPTAVTAVAGMAAQADSPAQAAPPFAASAVVAAPMPVAAGAVHLQVASFASRENAERALTRITAAGIAGGGLSEVVRDGKTLWRLRVSAGSADRAQGIAVRIGDLGLGQPQVVSD
jgi:rare lipoprotein A